MADDENQWPAWDSDSAGPRRVPEDPPEEAPDEAAGAEVVSGSLDLDSDSGSVLGRFDEPTQMVSRPERPPQEEDAQETRVTMQPVQPPADATQVFQPQNEPPTVFVPPSAPNALNAPPVLGAQEGATQAIPPVPGGGYDAPTVHAMAAMGAETDVYPAEEPAPTGRRMRTGLGRAMMVTGAVLGVLVLAYGLDLLVSWGDVPRGVMVAGVDVGGMTRADAEEKLRQELQPRFERDVTLHAGDVDAKLNPTESGLGVDWQLTLEQAGAQPLSPITRLTSFWSEREVGIVGKSDRPALKQGVQKLAKKRINHKKREGNIKFESAGGSGDAVQPVAVLPRQGQKLVSVEESMDTIESMWLHHDGVTLEVDTKPVKATEQGVQATIDQLAKPAVAAPIQVDGDGANGVLTPAEIGAAFDFAPAGDGSLKAKVDRKALKKALAEELAPSEREGQDAEIVFQGGKPTVKPGKEGRKVNWKKTFRPYLDVIKQSEGRVLTAAYAKKKPEVTTEEAKELGIKEVIGEFTTTGFASDSGVNIRRVAQEVNGAIVKPGATFSLNGHTGPRTSAQGYVPAGIIENGVPGEAVGGGISQFATTLYNASYFAGMKDAGHKEHSFYISRYPIAREATVFQSSTGASIIDIAFTNDAETGVAIQTNWTPSSITVKIWGTKRYEVESQTSGKSNVKEPGKKTIDDKDCSPSGGIAGFTATDTRIIRDLSGNEVRRETRTATYNPKPEVVCKDDSDSSNDDDDGG